jgi:hypothetical protein
MNTRTAACAVLLALTAALTACSSSDGVLKADPTACKAAMTKQFREGMAKGKDAPEGKRPAECEGVDDKTVQRYATEIMEKELPKAIASAMPDYTETTGITAACRDWIESELLDSSDDIDGTAGYGVCGDLTDEEMDQAIEDVTNDLIDQN